MNDIRDALIGAIMKEPEVSLHWFAYADWLEEQDCADTAFAHRWLGRNRRWPQRRLRYNDGRAVPAEFGYGWHRERHDGRLLRGNPQYGRENLLPVWLFPHITSADHRYFRCWNDAIGAVVKSLAIVRRGLGDV